MIKREYLTEYDEYLHGNRYNITISTDNFHVFKAIKAYAESVCVKREYYELADDGFCRGEREEENFLKMEQTASQKEDVKV